MVSSTVIDKLEAGYHRLQTTTPSQCHSLLKKHLTREVLEKLKHRQTRNGATLLDVVQSGFVNLDSTIGIYAPDIEAYTVFADLFDPILDEYHLGFKPNDRHPGVEFGEASCLGSVDSDGQYVISTRIRCARNIQGYPFSPSLSENQYQDIESAVVNTLANLQGDLSGNYYPLTRMSKKTQKQLAEDHFLFGTGDRFLDAANGYRYWPLGRGIYCNDAKTFLVWLNEEDELRIISMEKGGNLRAVYSRFTKGVESLAASVAFAHTDRLGFLNSCPSNLGTAMRASVLIKLPLLGSNPTELGRLALKHNLQIRGTNGEHSESVGSVYDISNIRRLGITEFQVINEVQNGVLALIKKEQELESTVGI